jgi:hypothetical protein
MEKYYLCIILLNGVEVTQKELEQHNNVLTLAQRLPPLGIFYFTYANITGT